MADQRKKGEEMAKLLLAMAENFNQELSEARLGLLLEALQPYSPDEVGAGVKKVLRRSRFFPSIAELLDAIEGSPQDGLTLEAEGQWRRLWIAADKGAWSTYYGEPDHPGPEHYLNPTAILTLRQMGGRSAMLTWVETDLHWRRREWVETYRFLAGNEQKLLEAGQLKQGALSEKVRALIAGIGDGGNGGRAAGKGSPAQRPAYPGADRC